MRFVDLSGKRFARLSVLSATAQRASGNVVFKCICDCGSIAFVSGDKLQNQNTKSCGCIKAERLYRHGLSRHPLYSTWHSMVSRCLDPAHPQWTDYGGRGISVSAAWTGIAGISNFIADMGDRPTGKSLDRVNNNGSYSKENCRWASDTEQQSNTRQNINITHLGRTMTVAAWAREMGVDKTTIYRRIKRGCAISDVLSHKHLTQHVDLRAE